MNECMACDVWYLVHVAGQGDEAGSDESNHGQHGDAAVLELSLAQPPHVDPVRETKGVEAYVHIIYINRKRYRDEKTISRYM